MSTVHAVPESSTARASGTPVVEVIPADGVVRVELGASAAQLLADLFAYLDSDPHLRTLVLAELTDHRRNRVQRRAQVATRIARRMSAAGLTSLDLTPAEATRFAEDLDGGASNAGDVVSRPVGIRAANAECDPQT